jgi:LAO/AO transport system kinase
MELASKILEGDILAASRLMRGIEDETPDAAAELKSLYPHTGRAYRVGVTGTSGAGKSTLIDCLINTFRRKNMTVGVIAVDPTSPLTGGAILGDRVRMQRHGLDNDVFIRSIAQRGWGGGLSKTTISMIHVMDAMGKDIILVETVGIGHAEINIVKVAHTSIVILTPGMGDEIQMIKAGILEVADIFVINKADTAGADNLKTQLEVMLEMRVCPSDRWKPGVVLTEANLCKGAEELTEEILRHKEFLISSGELEKRRKERAKLELVEAIESSVKNFMYNSIDKGYLERLVSDLAYRKIDPHSAALEVVSQFGKQLKPFRTRV